MATKPDHGSELASAVARDQPTRAPASTREGNVRSRPALKDLLELLKTVVDWQTLMLNLGVEKYQNDKIEKNFPNDVDRQKQEAFDLWLEQKSDASWRDIIDALYKMGKNSLATELSKKFEPHDPRKPRSAMDRFICAPRGERVKVVPLDPGAECRSVIPAPRGGTDYYTLALTRPLHPRDIASPETVKFFVGKMSPQITEYLKSIEESTSKDDFRVGIEARFGKVYWRYPESAAGWSPKSISYLKKEHKGTAFNPGVRECHISHLLEGRECLDTLKLVTLKFKITRGLATGSYNALIDESGTFHLDAVYRSSTTDPHTKYDVSIPGRKYDFRIGDSSALLLLESEHSLPCRIAREITSSMHRLPERKLSLMLHGSTRDCKWEVSFFRQRVQRQYDWKNDKKYQNVFKFPMLSMSRIHMWILVAYDIDQLDPANHPTLDIKKVPANSAVEISDFSLSRKEIELWAQKVFPKELNKTHPSREKYHHMQSTQGVNFPGERPQPPSDWTTENMMEDFTEFVGEAFKIAERLDSYPE